VQIDQNVNLTPRQTLIVEFWALNRRF
jgi:hypothetical protein